MQALKPIMPTLNTISYARKKFAQKIAVKEVRFLPDDVQRIYDTTDPLTFYAIDGYDDSGLLWACNGALEIPEFIPEDDFIREIREAFDFGEED